MKPTMAPEMAMPPLAMIEPVKRKPISDIEISPAACQVIDLAMSLILLSMGCSLMCGFELDVGFELIWNYLECCPMDIR